LRTSVERPRLLGVPARFTDNLQRDLSGVERTGPTRCWGFSLRTMWTRTHADLALPLFSKHIGIGARRRSSYPGSARTRWPRDPG